MPSRPELERALASQMPALSRSWRRLADRALANLGLSGSARWALVHLLRMEDPRQGDLAREIGITEASLVRTLQQLERAGLILRTADEGDRRANRLRLTQEGDAQARSANARLVELRAHLLAGIRDDELGTTLAVLERLETRIAEGLARP